MAAPESVAVASLYRAPWKVRWWKNMKKEWLLNTPRDPPKPKRSSCREIRRCLRRDTHSKSSLGYFPGTKSLTARNSIEITFDFHSITTRYIMFHFTSMLPDYKDSGSYRDSMDVWLHWVVNKRFRASLLFFPTIFTLLCVVRGA